MRAYKFLLLTFICTLLLACSDNKEPNSLGEAEFYFDEKLTSLSLDDNSFWIGGENGDIIHLENDNKTYYNLDEDRIYKVLKEIDNNRDTILWLGVRNSGLQQWRKSNHQLEKVKTFNLNLKDDKYSSYDIIKIQDDILTATSQGLYSVICDSLKLIYPSYNILKSSKGYSYPIKNLSKINDSLLLASTPRGVFIYNILSEKESSILESQNIEHVSSQNDTIYSVANGNLFVNNIEGELLHEIFIDKGVKLHYTVNNVHYLLADNYLFISKDLKDFIRVNTRRSFPLSSRNIVVTDTLEQFTYFLTTNALWKVSNNLDIFKGNKFIKTITSNDNKVYYLTALNELYVQNIASNQAKWIHTFHSEDNILWMEILDDDLYYFNVNNELKKKPISENWLKNYFFNQSETVVKCNERIVSAKLRKKVNSNEVYIGIQDGLLVAKNGKIDTIPTLENTYITAMFKHEFSSRLYIGTLNHGVYYLNNNDDLSLINTTKKVSFIQDVFATSNHNPQLIILTNKELIDLQLGESIKMKGYKKLLYANDSLFFAITESGLRKFELSNHHLLDKGLYFNNINFNPKASTIVKNQMFLGSNIGVLNINTTTDEDRWVEFNKANNINVLAFISICLLILIVVLFLIFIRFNRKKNYKFQLSKRKEDLQRRVDDLISFSPILGNQEKEELKEITEKLNTLNEENIPAKLWNKRIENISLLITQLNRKITLSIPHKLENQYLTIEKVKSIDKKDLLSKIQTALKSNDVQNIKDLLLNNETWLKNYENYCNSLENSILSLSEAMQLEGVNSNLLSKLEELKINDKLSLKSTILAYDKLKVEIKAIESSNATYKIGDYIADSLNYLTSKEDDICEVSKLVTQLYEIQRVQNLTNLDILKLLRPIDTQIILLKNLDTIHLSISDFKNIYFSIIEENEKQINKKFDKELYTVITERTKDIVKQLNNEIISFYNSLSVPNQHLLKDVLKISDFESQYARVLSILLCDKKIKRVFIPYLLGIYGNLNPVISRLINEKIKPKEAVLEKICQNQSEDYILASMILCLLH